MLVERGAARRGVISIYLVADLRGSKAFLIVGVTNISIYAPARQ